MDWAAIFNQYDASPAKQKTVTDFIDGHIGVHDWDNSDSVNDPLWGLKSLDNMMNDGEDVSSDVGYEDFVEKAGPLFPIPRGTYIEACCHHWARNNGAQDVMNVAPLSTHPFVNFQLDKFCQSLGLIPVAFEFPVSANDVRGRIDLILAEQTNAANIVLVDFKATTKARNIKHVIQLELYRYALLKQANRAQQAGMNIVGCYIFEFGFDEYGLSHVIQVSRMLPNLYDNALSTLMNTVEHWTDFQF